jgi:hypothetical protein
VTYRRCFGIPTGLFELTEKMVMCPYLSRQRFFQSQTEVSNGKNNKSTH